MCRRKTVSDPVSRNKFCGETDLDRFRASLDQTCKPRRKLAAPRSRDDRSPAQPPEDLGAMGINRRLTGGASGGARSSSGFRPRSCALPNSVDLPKLFTYRRARWSCIGVLEGLLSPRAHFVAAAVAFLIAGSATAFAENEDIGRPGPASSDGEAPPGLGLIVDGHAFGDEWTAVILSTPRGHFTVPGREERYMSSLGAEAGTPLANQNGPGADDDLSADFSSSHARGHSFSGDRDGL